MMKLYIIARNNDVIPQYSKDITKHGFEYGDDNPDLILSLGGDGTLLVAEREFPSVPKMMIRDSDICNKCTLSLFDSWLDTIKNNAYTIIEYDKLETEFRGKKLIAANDIVIRNKDPQEAIRFEVHVDEKPLRKELYIGDGVVISTPWGSAGYFEAITKKTFSKGLGIALNNVNDKKQDHYIGRDSEVKVILRRGQATLTSDNDKNLFVMDVGDSVTIKRYDKKTRIARPD